MAVRVDPAHPRRYLSIMSDFPDLPPDASAKRDTAPDAQFYAAPRFVAHIDARAIAAVTDLYRRRLPPGGDLLDLMSSWISHLPDEVTYGRVTGLGMNAAELDANPRLDRRLVQDLNADSALPIGDGSLDAAVLCVSVQYLQRPVEVFRDVARTLRPGAPFVATFSDRCFPTKAVAIWTALDGADQGRLVSLYLTRAGFERIEAVQLLERDRGGDPLWAVIGFRPG